MKIFGQALQDGHDGLMGVSKQYTVVLQCSINRLFSAFSNESSLSSLAILALACGLNAESSASTVLINVACTRTKANMFFILLPLGNLKRKTNDMSEIVSVIWPIGAVD